MVDVTDATFQTEVIERSDKVPVVVDLWAPWCAPCRKLGPILEQVIDDTGGQVALAKVDIDQNPRIQQMFGVQSIPAVFVVYQRQAAPGFQGALPEPQVRQFVESLLPTEAERELAELVAKGDEESLLTVLERVPGDVEATLLLADLYLGDGRNAEALDLLAKIPETPEVRHLAARARTAMAAANLGADPVDLAPEAGGGEGPLADVEAKLAALLDRIPADDHARVEYLDLLELMGPEDPRTAEHRKALSRKLF